MKVLIINHSPFIGSGSGIYTMNIAKAVKESGQEVRVITAANSLEFPDMEGIGVHPIFFKYKDNVENQIEFNVPCFDQYPTSDIVFYNMSKEQLKTYEDEFRKVLEEEINTFKPDIIHTQHIWIWSSIVTEYNIPTIITSHGSDMMGYDIDNRFYPYCIKAINGCDKIVTISKKNREVVTERFPEAEEKNVTLKNGYDTKVFYLANFDRKEILKEFGINKEYKKVVMFAGRLTENKGIDVLLKAAKKYEDGNTLTIIAGGRRTFRRFNKTSRRITIKRYSFCWWPNSRKFE